MSEVLPKKFENTPAGWCPQSGELFDIFHAYKKIGSCSLSLVESQNSPRKEAQFFPDSWFVYRSGNKMLPILEITGLETLQRQKIGNGRLCLQALYGLSKRRGCGGRMQVLSDFNSAGFYEHCGFLGGVAGENGLKYFNPTPKNLSLLFPNGVQQQGFLFIAAPVLGKVSKKLSDTDKALFDRILKRGSRS